MFSVHTTLWGWAENHLKLWSALWLGANHRQRDRCILMCVFTSAWAFKSLLQFLWEVPQEHPRGWCKCRTGQLSGESLGGLESGTVRVEALWRINFRGACWALILCLGHCQILAKHVGVKGMTEGRVLHKQIEGGQSRSPHFCERVTEQKWPTRVKAFTVEERSWKVARRAQVQGEVWLSCPVFFF